MGIFLSEQLDMDSCPHCGKANPTLVKAKDLIITQNHNHENNRWWGIYICSSCGGVVTACAPQNPSSHNNPHAYYITNIYPDILTISDLIPAKPREFLRQAQNSIHAPAGAIMLSASAVDAMLKEKGLAKGSLYDRIDEAAKKHLITEEMAKWAHQVRLDANDQRHADQDAPMPNEKDARLAFDFAAAFAEYLFVLPAKVTRGISDSKTEKPSG